MLTGVYVDPRSTTNSSNPRWIAIWRVETTAGRQFLHVKVGMHKSKEIATFEALASPPREVLAMRGVKC